jgi:hypothetical protein
MARLRCFASAARQSSLTAGVPSRSSSRERRAKYGRDTATDFQPAPGIEPFASPFLGPVEPVFLEAERLVRRVA